MPFLVQLAVKELHDKAASGSQFHGQEPSVVKKIYMGYNYYLILILADITVIITKPQKITWWTVSKVNSLKIIPPKG